MTTSLDIQQQTFNEFGEFAPLLKQMIDFLSGGLRKLRQLSLSQDYQYLVVTALMHEAQRSVLAASDLWTRGYYTQALAVARPAYESWLLCKWLDMHPEQAIDVLDRSKNKRFNFFGKMAKELEEKHPEATEQRFSIYQWYDEVSDRTHPRASMIAPSIVKLEDETGAVYLGPRFRLEIATEVARYIGILVYILPGAFDAYLRQHGDPNIFSKLRAERYDIRDKLVGIFEEWRPSADSDKE